MHHLFIYGAVRNGFEACNIHYEGHWKGWAREIETFLGHLGPKKVENMENVWEVPLCFYFVNISL
jgi:hypothetical protein